MRCYSTPADPDGQEVVLLARIWEEKITRDHPGPVGHLDAVMEIVAEPDHVEPERLPDRMRFYRCAGQPKNPMRWKP